jgi:hypothetical protein
MLFCRRISRRAPLSSQHYRIRHRLQYEVFMLEAEVHAAGALAVPWSSPFFHAGDESVY